MKSDTFSSLKTAGGNMFTLIPFAVVFTSALLLFSCGSSQTQLLSEAGSVEKRFSAKLQPTVRSWITDEAVKLARFSAEEDGIREAIGRRFAGQNLDDDSREVLTFLMIARAVELSNQQTRAFEEYQRAIRATTEKMREVLPKLQADLKKHSDLHDLAPIPPDLAGYKEEIRKIAKLMDRTPSWTTFVTENAYDDMMGLRAVQEDLKAKLDGMNEMSEMTSLRLQMTMDRRSKFISTLSNIMKKIATTQDTLVQNLK